MPDIACPHCGQSNEPERDVYWACFKLLKPSQEKPTEAPAVPPGLADAAAATTKIVVNGREYARLEDVPEPLRSSIKNGVDSARQGMMSGKRSRLVVNGVEYDRIEDVPEPFRTKLREGLAHAKTDVVKITKVIKRDP